jgi:hypothetical protein
VSCSWRHAARLALLTVAFAVGCQQPTTGVQADAVPERALGPLLQRLRDSYPDLRNGRFIILASMESPDEVGLFRVVNARGEPTREQPWLNLLRSREQTGVASLAARLHGSEERLILDGKRSSKLSVPRDWSRYALFLASVLAPSEGLALELTVESGAEAPVQWTRMARLSGGWNTLRFDLAELADEVDLTDVRAVSWRAPQASGPFDLVLDDLLLTDNQESILEPVTDRPQLYAFRLGRRLHVGVPDRFEMALSDGVITYWPDSSGKNQCPRTGLGPWPIPLSADRQAWHATPVRYDDPAHFAAWGASVGARQRLVECTPVRVVIESQWAFGATAGDEVDGERLPAGRPSHTWRYTCYPDGRVYIRTTSEGSGFDWPGEQVGYALALDGRHGFQRAKPAMPGAIGREPGPFVLMTCAGVACGDLLWGPHRPAREAEVLDLVSSDERRLAELIAPLPRGERVDAAHLLRLWPTDLETAADGASFMNDYRNPARVTVTLGSLRTDVPGDLDQDGFNESEGCYEIAAADGVARCTFDPAGRLRHDPVFRVHQTIGRRCWVYVEGQVFSGVGRDANGDLLIPMARLVDRPLRLEVHSRP